MNAASDRLSRAQQEALSAPLLIEDTEVVKMIAQLADERGTSMQDIVTAAVRDHWYRHSLASPAPEWLRKFWIDHPLPLPTGIKIDKKFYDSLNDEL